MANIRLSKKAIVMCLLLAFVFAMAGFNSCKKDNLASNDNVTVVFQPRLSTYNIFRGDPKNMVPQPGFYLFNLATTLFTDYAEKQRLIKLPVGTRMTRIDDDLPSFPDSTIIVKTFYYYNDARDTARGKRIIETRLLIKQQGSWNPATYVWNDDQSEAFLQESGSDTNVAWLDASGQRMATNYHIPNTRECNSCHNRNNVIVPIGTKLKTLNLEVIRNGRTQNQLAYFQSLGIMNTFDPVQVQSLPQAFNSRFSLEQQARAYLEINCSHCHSADGFAGFTNLHVPYTTALNQTGILTRKDGIVRRITTGEMPLLGTTIIHKEGLELIRNYINSLP